MKLPATSAASSRTSISISLLPTSTMDGISVNGAATSMHLAAAAQALERLPGNAEPVRCRQWAQTDQRVARGVAGVRAGEEGEVRFAIGIEDQRRSGWPQTPLAGADHDAARRTPRGSV